MKNYLKSWKFVMIYILLICLMSPIIIIGYVNKVYGMFEYLSIITLLLITPLSITSLFCDVLVYDMILNENIVKEIKGFVKIRYFMMLFFIFFYVVGIFMVISGDKPIVFYNAYIFILLPLIQQRVVLTKNRLYFGLTHIERQYIENVTKISEGCYRITDTNNKRYNILVKDNVDLFSTLM